MEISHFKVVKVFVFYFNTLHEHMSYYVCGKPTQYQCEYLLFRQWIQVFLPMSNSSLNKLRLRQKVWVRLSESGAQQWALNRRECCYSLILSSRILSTWKFTLDQEERKKTQPKYRLWMMKELLGVYVSIGMPQEIQGQIYHGGAGGCAPHLVVSSAPLEKSSTTGKYLLDHTFSVWPYIFCFSNND